jgi:hypothetical protein
MPSQTAKAPLPEFRFPAARSGRILALQHVLPMGTAEEQPQ